MSILKSELGEGSLRVQVRWACQLSLPVAQWHLPCSLQCHRPETWREWQASPEPRWIAATAILFPNILRRKEKAATLGSQRESTSTRSACRGPMPSFFVLWLLSVAGLQVIRSHEGSWDHLYLRRTTEQHMPAVEVKWKHRTASLRRATQSVSCARGILSSTEVLWWISRHS